ncbi:hypothetical protein FQA39_LY08489 [Lamprigera yunnana]|nr:hypothetical protein FQA39_LY08489 [Lamprigera yunnana]
MKLRQKSCYCSKQRYYDMRYISINLSNRQGSIISEAVFGVDAMVTEIAPRQEFSANHYKLIDIARETYDGYRTDEKQLKRQLEKLELDYYANTRGQGETRRFGTHKLRKIYPQSEIGTYCDKTVKETRLNLPTLPVIVVQNFEGYHASMINTESHNYFGEIPSLGIAGDMVVALALIQVEPVPYFHVGKLEGTIFTENLIGNLSPIGQKLLSNSQDTEIPRQGSTNIYQTLSSRATRMWSEQDCATCHTTIDLLFQQVREMTTSIDQQDFFLWGCLKTNDPAYNSQTVDEIKHEIRHVINDY